MTDFAGWDLFRARWKLACEAEEEQRIREIEDLEFEAGSHWDAKIKRDREKAGKPCLTIDLMSGPIKQVTNQQRTARPGIQISAVGGRADVKKAEVWQGLIRRVERLSNAGRVYTWAGQYQVKMGRGCWVVRNRYMGQSDEQDIRIEEVDNPHTVYIDPTCKKLDQSDKKWAIRFEDLTHDDYQSRFGDSALSGSLGNGWQSVGDAPPEWITSKHARIAEYYYVETERGETTPGGRQLTRNRVRWCLLNGTGEVLDSATIPGEFIPVVTIFGERRNIDGKVDFRGMVRMAKDPSRMEDWAESSLMEMISIAKTAPWLVEFRQIEGLEKIWETSNTNTTAVLPYHAVSSPNGASLPPPQRVAAGVDVSALTMAAQRMQNHVRGVMGNADVLQEETRKEQSGIAINARKQLQELGTSDYMENIGDGIVLTARIIMSMAAEVYDTPRIMRIVGEDEKDRAIVTMMGQEQQPAAQALMQQQGVDGMDDVFDLSGHPDDYDIAISAGRNYQTARQEAVEMISGAIQAYPALAPIALPVLFRNSDFEGAQEIAKKLEPPEDGKPDASALMQQVQQLSQQLQQAMKFIETEQAKQQAQVQKTQMDNQAELARAEMDNATKIELERIRANTSLQLEVMKAEAARAQMELTIGQSAVEMQAQQAHAGLEAEAARAHEAQMGERGHQQAQELAAQQGMQGMMGAEQQHAQALEQGQQASDLAPEPNGEA